MKLIILFALAIPVIHAQDEVISLTDWKTHAGDDARWAAPEFDDSAWERGRPGRYTPGNYQSGFRWYRARLTIPAVLVGNPLALAVGPLEEAYEAYVNGTLLGGVGVFEPVPSGRLARHRSFLIPPEPIANRTVTVAIRRWTGKAFISSINLASVGGRHAPQVGPAGLLTGQEQIHKLEGEMRTLPKHIACLLFVCVGLLALFLFSVQRNHPEYLWLGLSLCTAGLGPLVGLAANASGNLPLRSWTNSALAGGAAGQHFFALLFLRRLCPRLAWLLAIDMVVEIYAGVGVFASWALDVPFDVGRFFPASAAFGFVVQFLPAILMATERRAHGFALAAAVSLYPLAGSWGTIISPWLGLPRDFTLNGYRFDVRDVAELVFAVTALTVLYLRFRDSQAAQLNMEKELAAGQRVQQLLMESSTPEIPGFAIEKAYLPSREVGGDFYQLIPRPDGGLLAVIGDVSGKGLEAAMVGSTLLGSLRTLKSLPPGEVLARLNEAMRDGSRGGFVTCCCALFTPDGSVTLASAGHPSPYANECEVGIAAGLPLGVVDDAEYAETRIELGANAITFVSDGVVEAENAQRELFGFERTREISNKAAAEIAHAAKAWGQNDDITVVTVRRLT